MYGSQSELLAEGVDPKQLLGLMSDGDTQEDKDQFSVHVQDVGTCVCVNSFHWIKLVALNLTQIKKIHWTNLVLLQLAL